MYLLAYLMLVAAFMAALFLVGMAAVQLLQKKSILSEAVQNGAVQDGAAKAKTGLPAQRTGGRTPAPATDSELPPALLGWVEKGSLIVVGLMTMSSAILVSAFVVNDFSLSYVARYSDRFLDIFYRITAFWAGQEGSLLFWGWSVAIFGVFFLYSKAYSALSDQTKLWFWMFFLAVVAFFLLLITGWSNPFITYDIPPRDGNGLNPLLQNPGMIFHPPLLFLGYGGFVIPGCLALAQTLSRQGHVQDFRGGKSEGLWSDVCRPFTVVAWILLTAGIILGAWWAYMELGWGGYWAWDPVENASLIPWLMSTAFLHTSVVESRRGMFRRFNIMLICLTTISAFVATYIVRSGAIQSLHAYPDGGVALPLLIFILAFLVLTIVVTCAGEFKSRPLDEPASREGMLFLVSMLFIVLATVILTATLWPLLSKIWSSHSEGLLPDFYNRVCLPIFMLIAALLIFCPWVSWRSGNHAGASSDGSAGLADHAGHADHAPSATSGTAEAKSPKLPALFRDWKAVALLAGVFALGVPGFWYLMEAPSGLPFGEQISQLVSRPPLHAVAQLAASAAVSALLGLLLLFALRPSLLKVRSTLAAHGVHLGLLLMVLGVAFSGPYQQEGTFVLQIGKSAKIGDYDVKLEDIYKGEGSGYSFHEAELHISKNGSPLGVLSAERRSYFKYPRPFAEAATIFTLGDEPYASLLAVDEKRGMGQIRMTINPLINWLWIGGVLMCLFPLLSMFNTRRGRRDDEVANRARRAEHAGSGAGSELEGSES